ncbi:hypothetical protein CEP52_016560 [Fusarium oligoseptatum]|uniref:Choline transport protein n=1 Tax=Fusarium oligoseptatum TaxID=2604345 RepID=A0A428S2C6_9HYPO|nr:hypothetical protein CEP52_016560 [Fusarium oligoseptatum]
MAFKRGSQELDDMIPIKSPEQTAESLQEVGPDVFDHTQLARLGKRPVLKVRFESCHPAPRILNMGICCPAQLSVPDHPRFQLRHPSDVGRHSDELRTWAVKRRRGRHDLRFHICVDRQHQRLLNSLRTRLYRTNIRGAVPLGCHARSQMVFQVPELHHRLVDYCWLARHFGGCRFPYRYYDPGSRDIHDPVIYTQAWQGTLMLWLCVLVAVLINTVVSSMLPKLEAMILIMHIVGFFAVFITLVTFGAHGDARAVFFEFRNEGMWPTQSLSWFVGLLGCVFSFAGVDCSFHMCEEVRNPSRDVPRSIMASVGINGAMGLAMVIAMLYGATDIDKAISSPTGYPYIEIFYQATGSVAGTAAMTSLVIVMTLSASVGVIAASSRMFWAFARDRGVPFWSIVCKVDPRTNVPVWAITATSVISCLIGLINVGSAIVYNAIISVAISGLYSSYLVTASLLLYRRCGKGYKMPDPSAFPALADSATGQGQTLAWGPWHIPGVFGIVNNTFACLFMATVWFFSFWPPQASVDAASMNYSSLMTGGVALLGTVYYLVWAKNEYKGPRMEV